jgi:hypothetical protein
MDFRKATNIFARPDFDGDPVQIYEPAPPDQPPSHQMNLKNLKVLVTEVTIFLRGLKGQILILMTGKKVMEIDVNEIPHF